MIASFHSAVRNRWLAHWAAARPDYRTITNISISVTAKQHRRFLDSASAAPRTFLMGNLLR